MRSALREVLQTRLHVLAWDSALWCVIGALLGLALGLAAFFGLRALGAYQWQWRHAKWFRMIAGVTTVACVAGCTAGMGSLAGSAVGSETVLRESQLEPTYSRGWVERVRTWSPISM